MAGRERMRASEYKKNRTKIEPESKEYEETRSMKRENLRELGDDVRKRFKNVPGSLKDAGQRIMRGLKPTIDEVVESRPAMKSGGRVAKYSEGGMKKTKQVPKPAGRRGLPDFVTPDMLRPPNAGGVLRYTAEQRKRVNSLPLAQRTRIMALRAGKAKPMPRPGRGDGPGFKSDKMPRPAYKRPGTNPKPKQMPRPGMNPKMAATMAKMGSRAAAGMGLGSRGSMFARLKAGGDVYTTPGGPTRGKSGKIKKMAAGGMIPKEGKKSPNSMGTSYSAGGEAKVKVKGKAMNGCARTGLTRGRTV